MAIIVLSVLLALSFAANVYLIVYLAILFRIFDNTERGFRNPVVQQAMHKPGVAGGQAPTAGSIIPLTREIPNEENPA